MGPRNRFQGMNSAGPCNLAGRYDNPNTPRFLVPIDYLKIPALIRVVKNCHLELNMDSMQMFSRLGIRYKTLLSQNMLHTVTWCNETLFTHGILKSSTVEYSRCLQPWRTEERYRTCRFYVSPNLVWWSSIYRLWSAQKMNYTSLTHKLLRSNQPLY